MNFERFALRFPHATKRLGMLLMLALPGLVFGGMLFPGDGSNEPGFVPPPARPALPPPPPANISSGEAAIGGGGGVVPQSRSEKKNPPRPPVMFTKLTSPYGELDWNTRPNDLNNLLKSLKGMADVDFTHEHKAFEEVDANPEQNPILYRSGHFHFFLSDAERQKLREYLLAGGMIIFNAGMGSKPFYDSARREMELVLPEAPVQRLSPDHPIFNAYYDVGQVEYRRAVRDTGYTSNEPWLEGVTYNCRTVAVISRWGMEVGWDPIEDEDVLAYRPESAQRLGMNIVAYATAMRAWSQQAAQAMRFVDTPRATTGNSMRIAQIVYDGEWKTRHAGLSVLLQQFNRKTGIPVQFEQIEIGLTDPRLFDTPVAFIQGHEDFTLSPEEITALRRYLTRGGLLIAEACCGRRGFDFAFREAMRRVLPEASFRQPAPGHALLSLPNTITRAGVTPALAQQSGGEPAIEPRIQLLEHQGNVAVIYSSLGLAGGWELSPNPYAFAYDDSDALRLGENILMYVMLK